jgi:hypothetical protein
MSSHLGFDTMSIASMSSSTLPAMFHDPYDNDPVIMQLAFLEESEVRHHREFLRRIEEVRRVQLAQLERFERGTGSRRK